MCWYDPDHNKSCASKEYKIETIKPAVNKLFDFGEQTKREMRHVSLTLGGGDYLRNTLVLAHTLNSSHASLHLLDK